MIQIILVTTGDYCSVICHKIRDKVRGSVFTVTGNTFNTYQFRFYFCHLKPVLKKSLYMQMLTQIPK